MIEAIEVKTTIQPPVAVGLTASRKEFVARVRAATGRISHHLRRVDMETRASTAGPPAVAEIAVASAVITAAPTGYRRRQATRTRQANPRPRSVKNHALSCSHCHFESSNHDNA